MGISSVSPQGDQPPSSSNSNNNLLTAAVIGGVALAGIGIAGFALAQGGSPAPAASPPASAPAAQPAPLAQQGPLKPETIERAPDEVTKPLITPETAETHSRSPRLDPPNMFSEREGAAQRILTAHKRDPAFSINADAPEPAVIQPPHRAITLVTRWDQGSVSPTVTDDTYGNFMAGSVERTAERLAHGEISDIEALHQVGQAEQLRATLVSHGVPSERVADLSVEELGKYMNEDQEIRHNLVQRGKENFTFSLDHSKTSQFAEAVHPRNSWLPQPAMTAFHKDLVRSLRDSKPNDFEDASEYERNASMRAVLQKHTPALALDSTREPEDLTRLATSAERAWERLSKERRAQIVDSYLKEPQYLPHFQEFFAREAGEAYESDVVDAFHSTMQFTEDQGSMPLTGRYAYIFEPLREKMQTIITSGTRQKQNRDEESYIADRYRVELDPIKDGEDPAARRFRFENSLGTQITGRCSLDDDGRIASITSANLHPGIPMSNEERSLPSYAEDTKEIRRTEYQRSMNQAHNGYARALAAKSSQEAVNYALRGYWQVMQSGITNRGSAAIGEHGLRSVLLARGIELPPTAAGRSLNLEASIHSKSDFVKHAGSFFQDGLHLK